MHIAKVISKPKPPHVECEHCANNIIFESCAFHKQVLGFHMSNLGPQSMHDGEVSLIHANLKMVSYLLLSRLCASIMNEFSSVYSQEAISPSSFFHPPNVQVGVTFAIFAFSFKFIANVLISELFFLGKRSDQFFKRILIHCSYDVSLQREVVGAFNKCKLYQICTHLSYNKKKKKKKTWRCCCIDYNLTSKSINHVDAMYDFVSIFQA